MMLEAFGTVAGEAATEFSVCVCVTVLKIGLHVGIASKIALFLTVHKNPQELPLWPWVIGV